MYRTEKEPVERGNESNEKGSGGRNVDVETAGIWNKIYEVRS